MRSGDCANGGEELYVSCAHRSKHMQHEHQTESESAAAEAAE
jgi:hypothetical protein